ncbi:tRNA/rRNA methyltransferase [Hahella sp. SMD15-11]|uniref:tRNA (cytidine/uridine-2'-O-)-methyltransferase TrmJ n=1 Tax=Thermohahella caldifontis TaxID=3142973 RepID=A0AB39UUY5_9GAMM
MQLTFILVEPKVPENVGAACRALKTQGFSRLRIVNSRAHREPPARWVAHGADDVLEGIETFATLAEALADVDLSLATSAKARHDKRTVLEPDATLQLIRHHVPDAPHVAIVFGREDRGLSNEEVRQCDVLTTLPLAQPYPSLNLGQSVMLYAYLLRQGVSADPHLPASKPGQPEPSSARAEAVATPDAETRTIRQKDALRQRILRLFQQLDKVPGSPLEQWALEQLAWANEKDVKFLHTLCQSLEKALRSGNSNSPDS